MRRRDLLVGAGSLGLVGGAGLLVSDRSFMGGQTGVASVSIETLDAPGSDAGTITAPKRGTTTFIEFFATWCGVCESMMEPLSRVQSTVDDDVQFVSVTNEPIGQTTTREDVVQWWSEHDGNWTVGLDADYELTDALEIVEIPTAVVLDERNDVAWSGAGRKSPETLIERIDAAHSES
ncbi:TlpA family protein disulfide reductase [Halostagnicola kamekurae]|uniref:Redoxin n=1 Tax=Halostagnicola kamekurae TaxID=619731 RepID=A0A1I6THD7_9EURY|nr:TlpA disulfide reductase family protein [Halostagnicola kamekurae]SFS88609.1 Redoxin [Halostagnicola kamekurae]